MREKYQRIVDHRFIGRFHAVVSQCSIPGHIDTENQQTALPPQFGIGRGLNHRHGDIDFGDCLHSFQDGFFKSRIARHNLQLSSTGDFIHGLMKRREHALIRRVHAHKHSRAKNDSGGC